MSNTFEHHDVTFLYPENWTVEDDDRAEPITVTVANDTGAFWSVSIYKNAVDRAGLAREVLQALEEEYEQFESEAASEDIAGVHLDGYEAQFFVQHLIAAARIRVWQRGGRAFLLLCQAEDRDFEELDQVFQAMTVSLLSDGVPSE